MVTMAPRKYKTGFHPYYHHWTDEEREIVRRDYKGNNASALDLSKRLSILTGEPITFNAIKGQITRMGCAVITDRARWSQKEEERLRELIGQFCPGRIAKIMHRSINAVVVKSKRLNLSRRARDGWYTKRDVAEILGVDHHKVQFWIDTSALKAGWHSNMKPSKVGMAMWHIQEKDLRNFIIQHCMDLNGRNVDLFQIVSILLPNRSSNGSSEV